jgi:acetylornithine deacetylase/succinyl-diaminopimelate desuccinylase-like protein
MAGDRTEPDRSRRGRLEGADRSRGGLLIHGHLDAVPADASEWSVHPFSGAVQDDYVWGRGAVDMKDIMLCP